MTQESIITALQNGSLTSYQMENLTGIARTSIVAACKKLFHKKQLTTEKVEEPRDLLTPFDIRNAKGIFSKAEYASMNNQAIRLFGRKPTNEITNNQNI